METIPPTGAAQGIDTVNLKEEIKRTNPDYVVYAPADRTGKNGSTGNEHFLVFDGPDGSLMALWTQSTREGDPDQHVAFSKSFDEGKTWTPCRVLAGPPITETTYTASWQFPLITKSGRLYVIYSQGLGHEITPSHRLGAMMGIYSDDAGNTWSEPKRIPMAKSRHDASDPKYPSQWIVWQKPERLTPDGKYFVGMTCWVNASKRHPKPITSWIADESLISFLKFENIDENPDVEKIQIRHICREENEIRAPFPGTPTLSVAQEPSLVKLPDGRLFLAYRSSSGNPWWSVSADGGETWSKPEIIRLSDTGRELQHPLSPCPIYDMGGDAAGSGKYVFFIHNHDGHYGGFKPEDTGMNRRPVYILYGTFTPGAKQPVSFTEPELFMDQGPIGLGPIDRPRHDFALYASFTVRKGNAVLWYPERKTFLLGRKIEWKKGLGAKV